MSEQEDITQNEIKYQTFAEFLENSPPNQSVNISDLSNWDNVYGLTHHTLKTPEISLHCAHENCNGQRFFRCTANEQKSLDINKYEYFYMPYMCSNCQKKSKMFALVVKVYEVRKSAGECYKFGEYPTYGPPISPKLIKLIGRDRETFLSGRRCENQGLGVGAFAYYRRVVENQKNRILEEIIRVSEKVGAPEEKISILKNAAEETQFSKSFNMAKDSIPESLVINGRSPILLLHKALSKGIHTFSDQECLEIAGHVRLILAELSERLSQALKNEADLNKAISGLENIKK